MIINSIDKREALNYMGYRGNAPDDNVKALLDKYEKILLESVSPLYRYKVFDTGEIEFMLIGNDIKKHINDCNKTALMCVTLGVNADRLILKTESTDLTGAVVLDALAGALIEQVCDICENEIKEYVKSKTTPRFSPGFGDFPIEIQSDFLEVLDAGRKIGLTVNESNILIPRKSVTAVIGIY